LARDAALINAGKLTDGAKNEVGSRWVPEPERVLSSVELDDAVVVGGGDVFGCFWGDDGDGGALVQVGAKAHRSVTVGVGWEDEQR
jgi:hypothetical protein